MGPVNLVAIEEHEEMTQRFNFLTQQEQDLLKAKDDLHKAIQKINRTTRELSPRRSRRSGRISPNITGSLRRRFGRAGAAG